MCTNPTVSMPPSSFPCGRGIVGEGGGGCPSAVRVGPEEDEPAGRRGARRIREDAVEPGGVREGTDLPQRRRVDEHVVDVVGPGDPASFGDIHEMEGQEAGGAVERSWRGIIDVALVKARTWCERSQSLPGQRQHRPRGVDAVEAPTGMRLCKGFELQAAAGAEDEHLPIAGDAFGQLTYDWSVTGNGTPDGQTHVVANSWFKVLLGSSETQPASISVTVTDALGNVATGTLDYVPLPAVTRLAAQLRCRMEQLFPPQPYHMGDPWRGDIRDVPFTRVDLIRINRISAAIAETALELLRVQEEEARRKPDRLGGIRQEG